MFTRNERPPAGLPEPPLRGRALARRSWSPTATRNPTMTGTAGTVDVSAACPVLANWDLHVNLDSTGAILFERFMDKVGSGAARFSNPFDLSDPVNTPFGLEHADPAIERGLADAVTDLRGGQHRRSTRASATGQFEVRGDRADPDPRRRGRPGRLQRDLDDLGARRRLLRRRRGLELRHGDELQEGREVPEGPLDPHLLALGEPELEALRRPDPDVLEEEVGQPALLRERGREAARRASKVVRGG